MSIEEMVAAIQAGAVDRIGELWERVEGLVKWKAKQIMTALQGCAGRGVEFDDLCQSGISNTIGFDGTPGWMESKCKLGFSNTIGFDRKPEAMENCTSQPVRP